MDTRHRSEYRCWRVILWRIKDIVIVIVFVIIDIIDIVGANALDAQVEAVL
jgi:hypothetical protein